MTSNTAGSPGSPNAWVQIVTPPELMGVSFVVVLIGCIPFE
jgi:hypothetical protein